MVAPVFSFDQRR